MDQRKQLQASFIESIRAVIPAGHNLVNEIEDILEISADSAYRRLRGETEFSLSEIVRICSHFKISFDSFYASPGESVHFHYKIPQNNIEGYEQYLTHIRNGLEQLHKAHDRKIYYVADDIPLFLLFSYPNLAWFKSYYWMRSVMNVNDYQETYFEEVDAPATIMQIGAEILDFYRKIPSVEIWSEQSINSLLKQISFYAESGFFLSDETSKKLLNDLNKLLNDIRDMAAKGNKRVSHSEDQNFTFYVCDIEIGNNCILSTAGQNQKVFLRHSTFNTLETANSDFCIATKQWIDSLIGKSTQISTMGEKQRNQFFQNLKKKILKESVQ